MLYCKKSHAGARVLSNALCFLLLRRFFARFLFYSCGAATLLRYVCVPDKQQSASNMSAMLKSNFEIYH